MVIAEMAESGAFLGSAASAAGPGRRRGPLRIQGVVGERGHGGRPRPPARAAHGRLPADRRGHGDRARAPRRGDGGAARRRRPELDRAHRRRPRRRAARHLRGLPHGRLRQGLGASAARGDRSRGSRPRSRSRRSSPTSARAWSAIADPYLRERLHDLDDVANRLLRYLVQPGDGQPEEIPEGAVLVARNLGPGALMDHARAHLGRRAGGGLALLALRHRRAGAGHPDDRPGRPDHARRQSRRRDRRRRRDGPRPSATRPGDPRALPRQDRPRRAGAGGTTARWSGGRRRRADGTTVSAEDERRHPRRPALARAGRAPRASASTGPSCSS